MDNNHKCKSCPGGWRKQGAVSRKSESAGSVCNCGDCKHLKVSGTVSNGHGTCDCGHNIRESIVKSNQGTLKCDDYKPNSCIDGK